MAEITLPLYRIKCYNDYLYRVVKRCFSPSVLPRLSDKPDIPDDERERVKRLNNLARARSAVREYALCNNWEYFVTLTIDASKRDRYDLRSFLKEFMQWTQNLRKNGFPHLTYLLVPEFHQDGAVHLHGVMRGISVADQPAGTPRSIVATGYQCWPEYSARYGFSTVDRIRDPLATGFYISKYISKSMLDLSSYFGVHTYYHSRGLFRAVPVGDIFSNNVRLDELCRFGNEFYKAGFFKCESFDRVVDLCDEVHEMYQSWIISDPVSGEVVSVLGGDSDDVYIQEVIEGFQSQGLSCSLFDSAG